MPRPSADGSDDKLLMRFTLLDPADPEREFSIVMDISKSDFSGVCPSSSCHCSFCIELMIVPNCSPPLPDLGELVSQLNADRDLSLFIKRREFQRSFAVKKLMCQFANHSRR